MSKYNELHTLRTVGQAMERLACSKWKIYSLVRDGRLEKVMFDGRTRITERSLRRLERSIIKGQRHGSKSDDTLPR